MSDPALMLESLSAIPESIKNSSERDFSNRWDSHTVGIPIVGLHLYRITSVWLPLPHDATEDFAATLLGFRS